MATGISVSVAEFTLKMPSCTHSMHAVSHHDPNTTKMAVCPTVVWVKAWQLNAARNEKFRILATYIAQGNIKSSRRSRK